MTFDDWRKIGVENGWLRSWCMQHDWIGDLMTDDQLDEWEDGDDPCVRVLIVAESGIERNICSDS